MNKDNPQKTIKEIHLGDNTVRASAWILLIIFTLGALNFLIKKQIDFFYISLLIGVSLFIILILFPDKPPKKVSIDEDLGLITIHNYYPAKNKFIKISELSKIDWEINWHSYPAIIYIVFYDVHGAEIYSFSGYAAGNKKTKIKSIDNLSSKHEELINIVQQSIQEKRSGITQNQKG